MEANSPLIHILDEEPSLGSFFVGPKCFLTGFSLPPCEQ